MFSDPKGKETTPFRDAVSLIHANEVAGRGVGGEGKNLHPAVNIQYIRTHHSGGKHVVSEGRVKTPLILKCLVSAYQTLAGQE